MPKGPQGRNCPADVIGDAIKVTRLRAAGLLRCESSTFLIDQRRAEPCVISTR